MGVICEEREKPKIPGPKECESQIMEVKPEGKVEGAEEMKPLEKTDQKEKGKCICKIIGKEGIIGTGFFCKMIYQNELVPVLITNYHVIDDNYVGSNNSLKVYINEDYKFININKNKIIYSSSNNEYDIMIIRLKDGEIKNYLKIDKNIFQIQELSLTSL